jgi:hypothetical protein
VGVCTPDDEATVPTSAGCCAASCGGRVGATAAADAVVEITEGAGVVLLHFTADGGDDGGGAADAMSSFTDETAADDGATDGGAFFSAARLLFSVASDACDGGFSDAVVGLTSTAASCRLWASLVVVAVVGRLFTSFAGLLLERSDALLSAPSPLS